MPKLKTPLDVYKLLPKKNCGDCGIATCMAFAAAVIKQEQELSGCVHLAGDVINECGGSIERQTNLESIQEEQLRDLRTRLRTVDLPSRAELVKGRKKGESILITCLGRDFEVDAHGMLKSDCHTHAWFSIPLLDHLLTCTGADPAGQWVPFRELPSGRTWSRLFEQRCEKPLKQIADGHGALFEDLISMFSARSSPNAFNSDISVVLYPLPRVPLLICYWKPEDGMESRIHLFFDASAETQLHPESLFTLGTGIVRMLEKIMLKHTDAKSILS